VRSPSGESGRSFSSSGLAAGIKKLPCLDVGSAEGGQPPQARRAFAQVSALADRRVAGLGRRERIIIDGSIRGENPAPHEPSTESVAVLYAAL